MKTKKRAGATNRRKVVAKKTRRHGRPRKTDKKRSEGLLERTLDRLTPA